MCKITDFYQYKYCRSNYFINVIINIESQHMESNLLLKEKLKQKKI